jgi:hypothetical protein
MLSAHEMNAFATRREHCRKVRTKHSAAVSFAISTILLTFAKLKMLTYTYATMWERCLGKPHQHGEQLL